MRLRDVLWLSEDGGVLGAVNGSQICSIQVIIANHLITANMYYTCDFIVLERFLINISSDDADLLISHLYIYIYIYI